ncbi:unnamed protein product [Knipowitschia caucasica]
MSLRGPPATLRKTWRRSTDESYWDNFPLGASTPSPDRGSRPQSAVEGGQLDGWLKHLQRIQKTQIQVHVGQFGLQDKAARAKGSVPSSWGSSSGGTSLCGSSLGSQESLQNSAPSPPERRESWEKARISQPPKKEQSRVSFLTPVKIGWLPIRKKVTMVGEQGRGSHPSTQQVKLKPPITPTVMNTTSSSAKSPEGEEQRSQGKANGGLRTAWKNQDPAINKQGPERHFPAVTGGDGPVSWQSLKRGWRLNRVLALPGSSPNSKTSTETSVDPPASKTFTQPCDIHQDKQELVHRKTLPDQDREIVPYKTPLYRTSRAQPIKASHIQTTAKTKTLIPENKAGFSSITIASRKVCRSSSLPPSPSRPSTESMDSNPRQIMVQRKATIVKVTEQRVTTGTIRNVGQNQEASQNVDTVVRRRKATIIKVTEHRESFGPSNTPRNTQYRHSYTEGLYNENRFSSQPNHAMTDSTPIDTKPIHRSTLSLVVTPTPAILPPPAKPESEKAYVPKRPQRPSSCYGNVLENSVGVEEKKLQPLVRTLSLDSTQRNGLRSLDVMPANGGILELSKNGNRETAVPTLKLIKSPDPDQTPEDVLALNAAAIIANIKLQRKLSKKKTPSGKSENGSSPSPQDHCAVEDPAQDSAEDGNSETKARTAAFVPLSSDIQRSTPNMSLQEALLRSRPDLISRSKRRTEDLQRRVQQRRWTNSQSAQTGNTGKRNHLLKTRRQQPTSKWPTELQRRQEEEARREENLSNRQRADLFKKKLLDQVLQRGKD